jgi:hypothetical protein
MHSPMLATRRTPVVSTGVLSGAGLRPLQTGASLSTCALSITTQYNDQSIHEVSGHP